MAKYSFHQNFHVYDSWFIILNLWALDGNISGEHMEILVGKSTYSLKIKYVSWTSRTFQPLLAFVNI